MNAVDTNILVDAVSTDEVTHSRAAMGFLATLSETDTVLLWQVAAEFGAVVARLRQQGKVGDEAFESVDLFRKRFPLILPSQDVLERGLKIHREQQVSYWDAMLIAACEDAGIETLYTQDLQGRPTIAGVRIVNPLPPRNGL